MDVSSQIEHVLSQLLREEARQPLYTTKPELERSGMGFTIMENFMDDIEVDSQPGKGTEIRLRKHLQKSKMLCN